MRNWKAVLGRANTMEFGIPCLVGVENQQMDEEFFLLSMFLVLCVQKTVKNIPT